MIPDGNGGLGLEGVMLYKCCQNGTAVIDVFNIHFFSRLPCRRKSYCPIVF